MNIFVRAVVCILCLFAAGMTWDYDEDAGEYSWVGKRLSVRLYNEWSQIGRDLNWCNATAIEVSGEYEDMSKYYELRVILLGVGIIARYNYDFEHSEIHERATAAWDEIKRGEVEDGGFDGQ